MAITIPVFSSQKQYDYHEDDAQQNDAYHQEERYDVVSFRTRGAKMFDHVVEFAVVRVVIIRFLVFIIFVIGSTVEFVFGAFVRYSLSRFWNNRKKKK